MRSVRPWLSAVGLPALSALLFAPLALRLIQPNRAYGYRTLESLSSPEAWYRANEIAGWLGIGCSVAALLINVYLVWSGRPGLAWAVFVVAMLTCTATAFALNG